VTRAAVFLDRDGTLIDELGYLARPEGVRLFPGAATAVRALNEADLAVVVVTNQSGIARGLFGEPELAAVHARLREELARQGARLDGILHCPHHPDFGAPCACRKPAPGLLLEAARRLGLALGASWLVGDGKRDLEAGWQAELAGTVLVRTGKGAQALAELTPEERARTLVAADLAEAARLVLARQGR